MTDGATRVGWGYDAHRLGGEGPLVLAGVVVDRSIGLLGTSDGDVAAHAAADALLGAAGLGDLGAHFPSADPTWSGVDSIHLLRTVWGLVREAGWVVGNLDITIVAESVRIAPHREAMRARLADALEVEVDRVSVKATSTDGMGPLGAGDGIATQAVVLLLG